MNTELKNYIEQHILTHYEQFDPAHRRVHADTVIANSLTIARHYNVDLAMVYTIAAYHDVGLCQGRERHHLVSGEMLRADTTLLQWFTADQIETMAEAVEDHRASAQQPPRSLYGMIVAEADRNIDSTDIVRRTLQYGKAHHPDLDVEAQWQRCLSHLQEKYGTNGYLKLWLPESPNADRLCQLQALIADEARLRHLYDQLLTEENTQR